VNDQIFVTGVTIAVALVLGRMLAPRLKVPEPIILMLFGVLISILPGTQSTGFPPELVLTLFLPPLIYHAAFLTAPRETREDAVPISIMAFGLTTVSALAVAYTVGMTVPNLTWAAALALGAAVAPTDPVAATSVMQRVGAPRRLVTILEGESLANDAVALALFSFALVALSREVTVGDGAIVVIQIVAGGILYGSVLAWVIARIRPHLHDGVSQIVLSLATPFVAYLPAEHFGFSGVLATIVTGFYFGLRGQGMLQPASRVTGNVFWYVLIYLLESTLFVMLGLQITDVFASVADHSRGALILGAVVVVVVVVLVRLLWTLLVFPLANFRHKEALDWRMRLVMGWAGMRGAITLAIALSIPLSVQNRSFLIFIAACVVLATLMGQATTLAPLLRRLGLGTGEETVVEEANARAAMIEAALDRLDELTAEGEVDEESADVFRRLYELSLDQVRQILDDDGREVTGGSDARNRRVRKELTKAKRGQLDQLYRRGRISADTKRKLTLELDIEEQGRTSRGQ